MHGLGRDPPICLVADDVDVLALRADEEGWRIRTVRSLDDIHIELRAMASRAPAGSRMLDLIGHSTRDHRFLRIGDTGIDVYRPAVARVFDTIRNEGLLAQLGIASVRLLGCSTASRPSEQRTMRRLARMLDVPVFGATKDLLKWHYTEDGFNPKFNHILVEASELTAA